MNKERRKAGIKKMKRNKFLITIPLIYIGAMIYIWIILKAVLKRMGTPFSGKLFVITLSIVILAIIVVGIIGITERMGKPREAKKIQEKLKEINFVDNQNNPPTLLTYERVKLARTLELYSAGIPMEQYEKKQAKIETKLGMRIRQITEGKDNQHVIIQAVEAKNDEGKPINWKDDYLSQKDFELVLGKSEYGVESIDIESTPNILVGGGTGSGKTTLMKSLLMQALKKGAIVYLIDMKEGIDFPAPWTRNCTIITKQEGIVEMLEKIVEIMEERKALLVETGTNKIADYNKKTETKLKRIIIACDEIAEVTDKTGISKDQKEITAQIEALLAKLARQGRAEGILCAVR